MQCRLYSRRELVWGFSLAVLYAVAYLLCVLIFKVWPDFYGFNADGKWYISLVAMMAADIGIAVLLRFARNRLVASR